MALFITKPILWNHQGYRLPAGVKANSGWPKDHGFGHEEWNGSSALSYKADGVAYRLFHTEAIGNAPFEEEAGRIFVFMYASHDGLQELVGIAGNATCLVDHPEERNALAERLQLDRLAEEAWAIPRVRALKGNNRDAFDKVWRRDLAWIPNWRCPANTFLWLDEPAQLDPQALRGTAKLLTMFGRYTQIDEAGALQMMDFVPQGARGAPWHRIRAAIEGPGSFSVATDLSKIRSRKDVPQTTRQQLIDARLGQGRFRRNVEGLWDGACSVSGCALASVLRASHIVAWKRCDDRQRLDGANGLLLTADLDALFDAGLIAFDDDGEMRLSPLLSRGDRKLFRLPRPLRKKPTPSQRRYLADHRHHWVF